MQDGRATNGAADAIALLGPEHCSFWCVVSWAMFGIGLGQHAKSRHSLLFENQDLLLNALTGPIRPQKWLQPKKGMGTSRLTTFVTLFLIIRSFWKLLSGGVKSVVKGGACVNIQILHFRVKSGLEMFINSRIDCRMRISS